MCCGKSKDKNKDFIKLQQDMKRKKELAEKIGAMPFFKNTPEYIERKIKKYGPQYFDKGAK